MVVPFLLIAIASTRTPLRRMYTLTVCAPVAVMLSAGDATHVQIPASTGATCELTGALNGGGFWVSPTHTAFPVPVGSAMIRTHTKWLPVCRKLMRKSSRGACATAFAAEMSTAGLAGSACRPLVPENPVAGALVSTVQV
jgi:hypothetical protein